MKKRRHLQVIASVLLQLGTAQVNAQDTGTTETEDDQQVQTDKTGRTPLMIIVIAPKRLSELQNATMAVTALESEDLAFRDIGSLSEMQNSVPNLQYGDVSGVPMIAIRGIGFNLDHGFGEPGVAVHVDSVYLPRLGTALTAGMDMQRIEVLRGPQGTLYGRNATGGAANFVSAAPTERFAGGLTLGDGDFGRRQYEGYVSGPFTDWMRGRLYVLKDGFDGYGINEFSGQRVSGNDTEGVRGALAFDLNENLRLDLNIYNRVDEGSMPTTRPAKGTGVNSLLGVPVPDEYVGVRGSNQNIYADKDPYTRRETTLGIATLNWSFDAFDLKSISAFMDHTSVEDYDLDSTARFIINGLRDEESKAFSQEFNFSGTGVGGKLDWLAGLYYLNDKGHSNYIPVINVDTLLGVVETPTGATLELNAFLEDQDNVARAVFGELTWRFRDNFKLLVGARYSVETKSALQTFTARLDTSASPVSPVIATLDPVFDLLPLAGTPLAGLQGGGPDPLLNELLGPVLAQLIRASCENQQTEVTFRSFDPKIELSWEPNAATLVYLQNQSGFKAGGINLGGCGEAYVPEEINSTELGLKTILFDNRLVLNGALFAYKYKDYQVFELDGLGAQILNAPKVSGEGAELEIRYSPVEWMSIDAALSYLDAQYDEFVDGDGFENPNLFLEFEQPQDLSGNPINRAPRHTENIGLNFYIPVNFWGMDRLTLRAEVYHSDTIAFTQFAPQKETDRQEPFTTYNFYTALSSERNGWQFRGFIKNLTDEEYLSGVFPVDLFHLTAHSFAPPRTAGVELSYAW